MDPSSACPAAELDGQVLCLPGSLRCALTVDSYPVRPSAAVLFILWHATATGTQQCKAIYLLCFACTRMTASAVPAPMHPRLQVWEGHSAD